MTVELMRQFSLGKNTLAQNPTCEVSDDEPIADRVGPLALELPPEADPLPEDDNAALEVGEDNLDILEKGAMLLEQFASTPSWSHLAAAQNANRKIAVSTLRRRVAAAAEAFAVHQDTCLDRLLNYVQSQVNAGELKQICALQHSFYDETPMRMKVFFDSSHGDVQKAKVWVVERGLTLLLQRVRGGEEPSSKDFLLLNVMASPAVRATQNAVGESIHSMLHSCSQAGRELSGYTLRVRIAETDEAGANGRAEKMMQNDQATSSHLWSVCLAHKVHTAAKKVMDLFPTLITGIKNACLRMRGAGAVAVLRDSVRPLVDECFHYRSFQEGGVWQLSSKAQLYKKKILDAFQPGSAHPRKAAIVKLLCNLLNTDWQDNNLTHRCHGCCKDAAHCKEKLIHALQMFLTILRPPLMNTDNWAEWPHSLCIFGLGKAMHDFLPKLYRRAFGWGAGQNEIADGDEGIIHMGLDAREEADPGRDPTIETERAKIAKMQRLSWEFFQSPYLEDLLLLKIALGPQIGFMANILSQGGSAWELKQFENQAEFGWRNYRMRLWNDSVELDECIRLLLENVKSQTLWDHMLETDESRSNIWRSNLRLAACLWSLVRVRVKASPYHLSCLLTNGPNEERLEAAAAVLATPRCMRDRFTEDFCKAYPTPNAMVSESARQVVAAIELMVATTTYSTERLHSKNARASSRRIQTHTADIATIALPHMSYAGPSWTAEGRELKRKRKRPNMPDREEAQPRKKRRGGGGAWRAFTHYHLQGRRFSGQDMQHLKRLYGALSVEEKARWEGVGRAG